ncbi:MAG: hypothetical protein WBC51_17405 [Vicinamibacterales bacterium]
MTAWDYLLHARSKLKALEYFFSEMDPQSGLDQDATAGIAWILEEILDDLEPLTRMPVECQHWEPPDTEQQDA